MIINTKKVRIENLEDGIRVYTDSDAERQQKKLNELKVGDVFVQGSKKFAVLNHNDGLTSVIEVGELEIRKFDEDTNNWTSSELRNYLNTTVLQEYEEMFGAENIMEREVDLTSLDGLKDYGTVSDKIRLMKFEEYRLYQRVFEREEKWEWLITPWSTPTRDIQYSVCCVSACGRFSDDVCYDGDAVRPFCILKSNILVSVEEN